MSNTRTPRDSTIARDQTTRILIHQHPKVGDSIPPCHPPRRPARITSKRSGTSIHNKALNESDNETSPAEPVTRSVIASQSGDVTATSSTHGKRHVKFAQLEAVTIPDTIAPITERHPARNGEGRTYYEGEFVIDKVVDHGINDDDELVYRVRWHGYTRDEDSWQLTADVPRSHLVRYYRRMRLTPPSSLRDAQVG